MKTINKLIKMLRMDFSFLIHKKITVNEVYDFMTDIGFGFCDEDVDCDYI